MWSHASAIFASTVTILVSFEAILKRFSVRINFKSQFQSNDPVQALKYMNDSVQGLRRIEVCTLYF